MPLRVRLSITLVAIVLVPLTVTAFVVLFMINQQQQSRIGDQLEYGTTSLSAVLQAHARRADDAAGDAITAGAGVALSKKDTAAVQARVTQFARGSGADFVAIVDRRGSVVASTVKRPPAYSLAENAPGADAQIAAIARALNHRATPYALYSSVAITVNECATCVIGHAVAGFWLDDKTLQDVRPARADVTFVDPDRGPTTTTLRDPAQIESVVRAGPAAKAVKAGALLVSANKVLDGGPTAYASVSRAAAQQNQQRTWRGLAAIIAVFVVMAIMCGWLMARVTTRPLAELSDAALAVAGGKLDTHIDVRSRDEVGKLALAFNTMTDELRTYIEALQESRDELKRNLTRLGDTLSSTHDLKKMLAVIVETAMVTTRAEAGALMLFSGNRDELYLKVGRGLDGRVSSASVRVAVGAGVAGHVAQTGEGVHGLVGPDAQGELKLAASEPRADSVIAVPLKSQGRVIGVLNLYDRIDADSFDDNDLTTIRSFANQATVAIDNVLLHQEAQRLSITDGLTGLWNYRYFQMNFDKEIERASRFQRPLALLIFDLDKFKQVNDVHGHQRGDSVLIELATRVKGAIREVDTLARYGGEEFVLILPETDLDGATLAAGKICEIVRQRRFGTADEEPIRVTVSVGVAVYPEHGRSAATLIRSADAALYAAKDAGRDGYWVATVSEQVEEEPPAREPDDTGPGVIDGALLGPGVDGLPDALPPADGGEAATGGSDAAASDNAPADAASDDTGDAATDAPGDAADAVGDAADDGEQAAEAAGDGAVDAAGTPAAEDGDAPADEGGDTPVAKAGDTPTDETQPTEVLTR
ncbi:MAG TPA: diguanylate cyclase [Frankiaceae bacterium]|nr:diguanylate cyclase [Frankiaceae bacterium]